MDRQRELSAICAALIPDALIYKCVIGSQAYGLATEDSDVDTRGIFLAPPELLWSLQGAPAHLEVGDNAEVYWELSRFCVLGLKANPNILECLYTPLGEVMDTTGQELVDLRGAFVSQLAHQTYNGYVLSQFKKIEQDIRRSGQPKWKHVMHLLRLLLSGITLMREGKMELDAGHHREKLLAVRNGTIEWDEVERWRLQLHREFDDALASSSLPQLPDYQKVESFILRARRRSVMESKK